MSILAHISPSVHLAPFSSLLSSPPQPDNTLDLHPAPSTSIDEWTALSIASTVAEEESLRLEDAALESLRLEELEALAVRFGRGPVTDLDLIPAGGWA